MAAYLGYTLRMKMLFCGYITLHKIVFSRVSKITRTAKTLYEIKRVMYSYVGKL